MSLERIINDLKQVNHAKDLINKIAEENAIKQPSLQEIMNAYEHKETSDSPDPVEYYFENVRDSSYDSGWILENTYDTVVPKFNSNSWRHRARSSVRNALGDLLYYKYPQWSTSELAE